MRVVVQRVSGAHITIDGQEEKNMGEGIVILLGIESGDEGKDIDWLTGKISRLRIFNDQTGVMNRSVTDVKGAVMVVSQFTLHASTKKGNRPSYIRVAEPELASHLYDRFISSMELALGQPVITGKFGAYMQITLTNDGPVTILIDSKNRE
jgi:D-tyrosyl-tRNA(Tyr) deacylase